MSDTTLPVDTAVPTVPEGQTPATTTTPVDTNELEAQNARLRNQVSAQDKLLNELKTQVSNLTGGFAKALGVSDETKPITIEELQRQIIELKEKDARNEKELQKANFIDSLPDLTPAIKQELKRRVSPLEDWQVAVEREKLALQSLLSAEIGSKTATDTRPVSQGVTSVKQNPSANDILANPKLYRQTVGI